MYNVKIIQQLDYKWIPGVVINKRGSNVFDVKTDDKEIVRHANQIRKLRHSCIPNIVPVSESNKHAVPVEAVANNSTNNSNVQNVQTDSNVTSSIATVTDLSNYDNVNGAGPSTTNETRYNLRCRKKNCTIYNYFYLLNDNVVCLS